MNKKRTKGFTLIELLAVIVILAIIALIAVPVIMNIINKANKSAFKDTAYGIINAGELYFAERQLEPLGMQNNVTIKLPDTTKTLELKGEVPTGEILITKDGKIALFIKNNRYCITKGLDDKDITVTEDIENCKLPTENGGAGGSSDVLDNEWPIEWKQSEVSGNAQVVVAEGLVLRRVSDIDITKESTNLKVEMTANVGTDTTTVECIQNGDYSYIAIIGDFWVGISFDYIIAGEYDDITVSETGLYWSIFDFDTSIEPDATYDIKFKISKNESESGESGNPVQPSLPELGTTAENCTWEEITAIGNAGKADEYFNLGDTKTITLTTGEEVLMEIVAFDADEKTDGSKAAITWLSKNLLATKHNMISSLSNFAGWRASEMRSWLQSDVYNTLPSEVKNAIVEVEKTYYNNTTSSTLTYTDTVWIPSYREMFGGTSFETSGATYTSYFTSDISRIKYYYNGNASWWLRSACIDFSGGFELVESDGSSGSTNSNIDNGVALGFCT